MRIAINASFRIQGGAELHLRRLLRAWCLEGLDREHEIAVFVHAEDVGCLDLSGDARIRIEPLSLHWLVGDARLAWEQLLLPKILADSRFDVLFCPGGIVPFRSLVPSVVAFQNAAPFCDRVTLRTSGAYRYARFRLLGQFMRFSARAAERVIFISHYLRDLFEERYGYPREKSDVIYLGRDGLDLNRPADAVLRELGLERPYILSVGHLYPYKNIPELIHAYGLARETLQRQGLRLAIVGKPDRPFYLRRLRRLISELKLEDWVLLTGGVPHEEIGPLLANCEFFVFQSCCENCPSTLIEAMAAGVPVASSNVGVMPEIAGDAAHYFDPFDPLGISRTLLRMAQDSALRADLRVLGPRQALKFPTWSEVARLTFRSLARAAGSR